MKGISWIGLRTKADFVALGRALRKNQDHLEVLELDFIDWSLVEYHWDDLDQDAEKFFSHVLRVQPRSTELRYPALVQLSLSGIDLTLYSEGVAYAMNATCLRSITLRGCPGWEVFLQHLVMASSEVCIRSLEIYHTVDAQGFDGEEEHILATCLESIHGLEDLYLSLPGSTATRTVWGAAARHAITLQRFAYHTRHLDVDDESEFLAEEIDLMDMDLQSDCLRDDGRSEAVEADNEPWFTEQSPNPLAALNIEFIGLACHPRRLVTPQTPAPLLFV